MCAAVISMVSAKISRKTHFSSKREILTLKQQILGLTTENYRKCWGPHITW